VNSEQAAWQVAFSPIRPSLSLKNTIHLSRGSSVGVVTRSADRRVRCSISNRGKTFLSSPKVRTGYGAHAGSYSVGTGIVSSN
jgi:hypothetical protein